MAITAPPTDRPSPVERVMTKLISAGVIVGVDPLTSTVTVTGRPVSADTAFHWLFAVAASGMVRDDTTMRGTTRDGVTVVIPTMASAAIALGGAK
jgi:hypothetical protein